MVDVFLRINGYAMTQDSVLIYEHAIKLSRLEHSIWSFWCLGWSLLFYHGPDSINHFPAAHRRSDMAPQYRRRRFYCRTGEHRAVRIGFSPYQLK